MADGEQKELESCKKRAKPAGTEQSNLESCKKRALRLLGKRSFSENELAKRLTQKGESEENARLTVAWLVEMGYLNDENYAAAIVNHYTANGYGEARIRDELYKRGIPREMWDEAIFAAKNSDDDTSEDGAEQRYAPAVALLRKKLRGNKPQSGERQCGEQHCGYDKDELRRAKEMLVRRGFSYDEARDALNRYLNEQEN